MLNAFKYTKQLEDAGFSREQAEIQLQVMTEIVEGDLATKQDLQNIESTIKNVESALRKDMHLAETEIRKDLELRVNNLENKMQQFEYRITIKLGTFLLIGFTTMVTFLKLWIVH